MSAKSEYYSTGGGELHFTPITAGVYGTEVEFGQTENVTFSSEIETLTHDNTEGSVMIEDLNILKKITGKLNIDTVEISPEMLTRAYLGENNTSAVIANAITGTPELGFVTATAMDTAYPIGVKHLDVATIVVKDSTDITTYTLDDDYSLSTVNGVTSITFITGGSGGILAGDVIHITGDNSAYDDISIEGFLNSKLEGKLRFVSAPANGIAYEYTFYRVSLLVSGDFTLKSAEELAKLSFEGTMLASEIDGDGTATSKLFKIEGTKLTA